MLVGYKHNPYSLDVTQHVFRIDSGVPGLANFQSTTADRSLTESLTNIDFMNARTNPQRSTDKFQISHFIQNLQIQSQRLLDLEKHLKVTTFRKSCFSLFF